MMREDTYDAPVCLLNPDVIHFKVRGRMGKELRFRLVRWLLHDASLTIHMPLEGDCDPMYRLSDDKRHIDYGYFFLHKLSGNRWLIVG